MAQGAEDLEELRLLYDGELEAAEGRVAAQDQILEQDGERAKGV